MTVKEYLKSHKIVDRVAHLILYFAVMEIINLIIRSEHLAFLIIALMIAVYHDIFEPVLKKIFKY